MNFKTSQLILSQLLFLLHLASQSFAQTHRKQRFDNVVAEMQVVCHSDSMVLKVNTNAPFHGMFYAKDAPSNSNCVTEFDSATNMTFRLPLKSCGTLFVEVDDGIEYFNTIVVQPHMRLMTNQGKGYHIRCKYQTRERKIANTHFNVSASFVTQNNPLAVSTPLLATASMPSCTMKIFRSGRADVAETVRIGDKLIMVIEIDQQDMYGMKVTNCVVRDGLNMAEQLLINESGCPVEESIMPKFDYSNNFTRASVSFPAHKFPHTSSVYYQCNVRLCINNGGCHTQADCQAGGRAAANSVGQPESGVGARQAGSELGSTSGLGRSSASGEQAARKKRSANRDSEPGQPRGEPAASKSRRRNAAKAGGARAPGAAPNDMSFDVYSGLYVNDMDIGESNADAAHPIAPASGISAPDEGQSTAAICLSFGQASLILLVTCATSVGMVLVLVCQVGLFCGEDQQVLSFGRRRAAASLSGGHSGYRAHNATLADGSGAHLKRAPALQPYYSRYEAGS